jgi:PqqD family protein of HPr-rel-A system
MPGPRYVADAADATCSVELDGLTALFHRPSGMTHLLAPPAPQILEAIANNPGNASEIMERMSERFELEGGEEAIVARLAELEASGLVWRP